LFLSYVKNNPESWEKELEKVGNSTTTLWIIFFFK
jgi:hypothetical protein